MFVEIGNRTIDAEVYLDVIEEYINADSTMTFKDYIISKGYKLPKNMDETCEFITKYGSKEMYETFIFKHYPLGEIGKIASDEQIKIRNNVLDLSNKIIEGRANLIDIIEQVTPNINEFLYYLKQVRYYYKQINESTFVQCRTYLETVKNYTKCTIMTVEFASISKEDKLFLIKMLKDRNMPVNNITYSAIYDYAMNHKLLKKLGGNMNYTIEEKQELYTELVTSFLKDKEYDIVDYIRIHGYPIKSQFAVVVKQCKKYISDELYIALIDKVFPFGVIGENSSEEQKQMREKIKLLSENIAYQNANLIDVFDLFGKDLNKYLYYLRLSKHYYNDIGSGVYQKVKDYINENKNYSSLEIGKVSYKDMLEEEDAILKQMLEERNLPINSITYGAIREYALVRGIIKHGKLEKNSIR